MVKAYKTNIGTHFVFNEGGQWLTLTLALYIDILLIRIWCGYPLPIELDMMVRVRDFNALGWLRVVSVAIAVLLVVGVML